MRIGQLEIEMYQDTKSATLTKHFNDSVRAELSLSENDIYALEFAVKEIKRKLNLK